MDDDLMIGGEAFMARIKATTHVPELPKEVIKFREIVSGMKKMILKSLEDKSKWGKYDAQMEQKFIDAGDKIIQLGNIIMHILNPNDKTLEDEEHAKYVKEIEPVLEYFGEHGFDFSSLEPESLRLCIHYVVTDTKDHTFDVNGHSSALIKH